MFQYSQSGRICCHYAICCLVAAYMLEIAGRKVLPSLPVAQVVKGRVRLQEETALQHRVRGAVHLRPPLASPAVRIPSMLVLEHFGANSARLSLSEAYASCHLGVAGWPRRCQDSAPGFGWLEQQTRTIQKQHAATEKPAPPVAPVRCYRWPQADVRMQLSIEAPRRQCCNLW